MTTSPHCLLIVFTLFFGTSVFAAPNQLGDLDGDGQATVFDLTRLIAHLNNAPALTPAGQLSADMDEDGDVDQVDAQLLRDAVLLRRVLEEPTVTYRLATNPETTSDQNANIAGATYPGATILIEGASSPVTVAVGSDGGFDIDVLLKENQLNRIFVTVFDDEGNASPPRAFQISHDAQAPHLFIDFPANNSEVITETVDIAGRVGDMLSGYRGLDVRVNGESAEVIVGIGQNGTFERSQVPIELGKNEISVTALDALGNTVTKSIDLYRIEPTGPIIEVVSGNNQAHIVNEILYEPATVRIRFPNGTPIANKFVTFKVIKSNGMIAETGAWESFVGAGLFYQTLTDSQGMAKVHWRLGHDAGCGNNRLQVTSKDVAGTAFFCASAFSAPPSQINIGSGNNQRGAAGSFAVEPLRVWVNDSCNGAEDISVHFRILSGDGTVNGESDVVVQTTRTGHAGVEFKLGSTAGNNIIEADFEGNPGPPATFVVFGVGGQSGADTTWEGIILDNANSPVGGAECQLEIGGVLQPKVLSGINGVFRMENVPAGAGHLHVEGAVATTLNGEEIPIGSFPALHYEVLVVENAVNSLGEAVLLPALDPVNAHEFDNSKDLVLTCQGIEGLKMTIAAGSMRLADGTKPDWRNPAIVSLNQVHHDDAPMPMPDGVSPPFAWTLQPSGATFSTPVKIEYPNMKGLAPGAVAYFLSYDHDMEEFVIVASGHVTDDGSTIVTDQGVGIEKAGWGCNCPPYSVTADCCVETGNILSDWSNWSCSASGSFESTGSLSFTQKKIIIGDPIPVPSISGVSIKAGKKKKTRSYTPPVCPDTQAQTPTLSQEGSVSYSSITEWTPEDPSKVDSATLGVGTHTFTAKARGVSGDAICSDLSPATVGTYTLVIEPAPVRIIARGSGSAGTRESESNLVMVAAPGLARSAVISLMEPANPPSGQPEWSGSGVPAGSNGKKEFSWSSAFDSNVSASIEATSDSLNIEIVSKLENKISLDFTKGSKFGKFVTLANTTISKFDDTKKLSVSGSLELSSERVDFYNDGSQYGHKIKVEGKIGATIPPLETPDKFQIPTPIPAVFVAFKAKLEETGMTLSGSGSYDESLSSRGVISGSISAGTTGSVQVSLKGDILVADISSGVRGSVRLEVKGEIKFENRCVISEIKFGFTETKVVIFATAKIDIPALGETQVTFFEIPYDIDFLEAQQSTGPMELLCLE